MRNHKTWSGMVAAVERTISELETDGIRDDHEYKRLNKTISGLFAELNALWTNPADVDEAARLRNRLSDAWDNALH